MKNLILIFFTVLFSFCKSQTFTSPKYIVKYENDGKLEQTKDLNLFHLTLVQYIGDYKSKIELICNSEERDNPLLKSNYLAINDSIEKAYNHRNYQNLKIFVDTNQITPLSISKVDTTKITSEELEAELDRLNYGEKPSRIIPKVIRQYDGFPVTIVNNSNKNEVIGFGNHIPLELEALNKKNEWQSVYSFRRYNCSFAFKFIELKKNEIATVFMPRFYGNFKTKFRYKLANLISNEFEGSIDEELISK